MHFTRHGRFLRSVLYRKPISKCTSIKQQHFLQILNFEEHFVELPQNVFLINRLRQKERGTPSSKSPQGKTQLYLPRNHSQSQYQRKYHSTTQRKVESMIIQSLVLMASCPTSLRWKLFGRIGGLGIDGCNVMPSHILKTSRLSGVCSYLRKRIDKEKYSEIDNYIHISTKAKIQSPIQ